MKVRFLKDRNGNIDRNYVIAEDGSYIRNKRTGKKLDNIYIHQKYRKISIYLNGKYYDSIKICHLQYLAWKGLIPKGYVVHHKDEDKLNDHKDNQRCLTNSEHTRIHHTGKHCSEETRKKMSKFRKGKNNGKNNPMYGRLGERAPMYGRSGEKSPTAILTGDEVKKIRKLSYFNKAPQQDLAIKFKVSVGCINGVVQGYSWNPDNLTKYELRVNSI